MLIKRQIGTECTPAEESRLTQVHAAARDPEIKCGGTHAKRHAQRHATFAVQHADAASQGNNGIAARKLYPGSKAADIRERESAIRPIDTGVHAGNTGIGNTHLRRTGPANVQGSVFRREQ